MRYPAFLALLLAGCTATQWNKAGTTPADQDRDFEECRQIAKPDPAIAAIFGVFGAIGVFAGVSTIDSRIRACMEGRGWKKVDEQAKPQASPSAPPPQEAQPAKAPYGAD